MALIAMIFSFAVAWIAFQGVNGSTMVNIAINGIQIVALLFFSALAIAYRMSHPAGAAGLGSTRAATSSPRSQLRVQQRHPGASERAVGPAAASFFTG